jgi:hypothetical protein
VVTLDEITAALAELLTELRVENAETRDEVTPVDVSTYRELGVLSQDPGLVVRLSDGRAFALVLTEYRR